MPLVQEYFSTCTNARLEAADTYLPLDPASQADLLNILSGVDDYIFLSISNERNLEVVKARNVSGTIIIERAQEGTIAVLHRFGSQVCSASPLMFAVAKDLVCNHNCCAPNDCPCDPVKFSGSVLPGGNVGKAWQGSVIFSGDLPMNIGCSGLPAWLTAVQHGNSLTLSGTPTNAATSTFSVAATNCNGTKIVTQTLSVTIAN